MSKDKVLDLLRVKGMHLVADVLEAERPRSVIVRIDYERQIGQLGSYLLDRYPEWKVDLYQAGVAERHEQSQRPPRSR